jgi:hypothetical protein
MSMDGQAAANYIALGSLITNLVVLIFLVVQLAFLRDQIRNAQEVFIVEQQRSNRQSTLEFLAATIERREEIAAQIPSSSSKSEFAQFFTSLDDNPDNRHRLMVLLNYYESLAAGVNVGAFNVEIVDRVVGHTIVRLYDTFCEFIEKRRIQSQSPKAYVELEQLAELIRVRRTKLGEPSGK